MHMCEFNHASKIPNGQMALHRSLAIHDYSLYAMGVIMAYPNGSYAWSVTYDEPSVMAQIAHRRPVVAS